MLYKTISSGRYLRSLHRLEVGDVTITSYVGDIITSLRGVTHLTLRDIRVPDAQIAKRLVPRDIQFLSLRGLKIATIEELLPLARVFANMRCLAMHLNWRILHKWTADESCLERVREQFPVLTTVVVYVRGVKGVESRGVGSGVKMFVRDLVVVINDQGLMTSVIERVMFPGFLVFIDFLIPSTWPYDSLCSLFFPLFLSGCFNSNGWFSLVLRTFSFII